jgi:hypothetical protein
MIVRNFPCDPRAVYVDHPYEVPRTDQVFQAWDGLGFGELEFHSPGLDAEFGPRCYEGIDSLWFFAGEAGAIVSLAANLLQTDVGYILK